jgi:sugar phosphate isomerase/epimerase
MLFIYSLLGNLGLSYGQSHSAVDNPVAGGDTDYFKKYTEAEMAICKALNIPNMVVHAGIRNETKRYGCDGNTRSEFFDKNRECYLGIVPIAEKYGVEILVENIGCLSDLYYYIRDGKELREMVDYVGHPLVNACWDVGHANHNRQFDQYESIVTLGNKLKALHIQDNFSGIHVPDFKFWADLHQIPFWGNTNWDSVIQGLLDNGKP